jgi:putative ABC transport system permease protein
LWRREFSRDPAAVGRTLRLDDRPYTVIGVLRDGADFGVLQILSAADYSRGFADRDPRSQVDVWVPLQADPEQLVRDTHPLIMIGRLAADATVAGAQEELSAIAADLERTYPSNRARGVNVQPVHDVVFGRTRPALLVLMAAVGLVLLISCVNVASLLLARGTVRRREVAVRAALGAGIPQLARQFVVENLLLTGIAAGIGIGVAFVTLRVLVALAPPEVPRLALASVDARVLGVTLAISVAVGSLFGLLPVLQGRRTDVRAALDAEEARGTTGGREGAVVRGALVVAEIALAVVLVSSAGLLIKSFWQLRQVDPGFDPSGVLKAEFQLPASRYSTPLDRYPNIPAVHAFNDMLLRRAAALPGVESSAIAVSHPVSAGFTNSFVIVGREEESRDLPEMSMRQVSPGYFRTVRLPLRRGRAIEDRDGTFAPAVAVINEAAAERLFAESDPIGQQLAFWGARRTIVGVVGNEKFHGLTAASPIAAYLPVAQVPTRGGGEVLMVRTAGNPESLSGPLRAVFREIDAGLAIFGVEPLDITLSESIATERFLMVLLVLFASLALVLAAIGIHGILSYNVAQRTREIGIRMALGAPQKRVIHLVLIQGATLTLCGLAAGLALALVAARLMSGLLFGVATTDMPTLAAVLTVLTLVAAIATWVPVRRATRVDPIAALRQE